MQMWRIDLWTQSGKGRGKRAERVTDTYSVLVKQTANGELLYSTGSPAGCSVTTWMGGRVGERLSREGPHVYLRLIPVAIQQKPTEHSKAIVLQLKNF